MRTHPNAIRLRGWLVEFTPGTESQEMAIEEMTFNGLSSATILARGASPGEWFALDATLHATDQEPRFDNSPVTAPTLARL